MILVKRFLLSGFDDLPGSKILGAGTAAKFDMTVSQFKYSGLLCGNVLLLLC